MKTMTTNNNRVQIIQYYRGSMTVFDAEVTNDSDYEEIVAAQERLKADGIIDLYLVRRVEQ